MIRLIQMVQTEPWLEPSKGIQFRQQSLAVAGGQRRKEAV